MSAPHNPSAFPVNAANDPAPGAYVAEPGMSLRDWFAGQVLAGICAHTDTWGIAHPAGMAIATYEYADAMLAAREQKA